MFVDGIYRQIIDRSGRLTYHFAWGAMRQRPVLVEGAAARLAELIREKAAAMRIIVRGLEIRCDRVYVVVEAPPTISPHRIVCGLKAHSSGPLRREYKELRALPTLWTRHYLVAIGDGLTVDDVLAAYDASLAPRRPRGRPRCMRP